MQTKMGRYIPWIIAFLIIFVLLMLLVSGRMGTVGAFGRYTPLVIAFLVIYVLLMFLVNGKLLQRIGRGA